MAGSTVRWESLGRLQAKLDKYKDLLGGKGGASLVGDYRRAIEADNVDKAVRGVDRHGHPLTPLISRRKGKYRGATGHPLSPFGRASRVVTNFHTKWAKKSGSFSIAAGWRDVHDKKGRPFLHYHFDGAGHNPRRDLAGITPKGWAAIRSLTAAWLRSKAYLQ